MEYFGEFPLSIFIGQKVKIEEPHSTLLDKSYFNRTYTVTPITFVCFHPFLYVSMSYCCSIS